MNRFQRLTCSLVITDNNESVILFRYSTNIEIRFQLNRFTQIESHIFKHLSCLQELNDEDIVSPEYFQLIGVDEILGKMFFFGSKATLRKTGINHWKIDSQKDTFGVSRKEPRKIISGECGEH